jgi:3-hydroxybutyryl-CoA dehydrogenase
MRDHVTDVGVVGLGVMGFDIAFLYAMSGYRTLVHDASSRAMQAVLERRERTIERLKRRNRISDQETAQVRERLIPASDLASLAQMDLITEAVSENAAVKRELYRALRSAGFRGLLTTNTSSVTRATLLADGAVDRSKFVLTHFFNPVLFTRMIEVVKGDMDAAGSAAVFSFLKNLRRDPVETQDISGFVSNGILMVYAVMALRLLEHGAGIEAVDRAARELRLLPPFLSFDSWTPSIVEDVTRIMADLRGDPFLRSARLLSALAQDKRAFYIDQKPNRAIDQLAGAASHVDDAAIKSALKTSILIAAVRVAELGESPSTVDFVATEGIKIPTPPLKEVDTIGAESLLRELHKINDWLGDGYLAAPRLLIAMADERQTFYKDNQPNPWIKLHSGIAT